MKSTGATTPTTAAPAKLAVSQASYDALMTKAEAALTAPSQSNSSPEAAAITLFQQAAQATPDDEKKARALLRAGETASQIKGYLLAARLFDAARKLTKSTPEQQARAQFGFAASRHEDARANNRPLRLVAPIQTDYIAALKMPQLPGNLRIQAHEAVGDLLLLSGKRLDAIREYHKILVVPNAKNAPSQIFYLNRIFAELAKAPASPDALALADLAYKQYLPLQSTPAAAAAARHDFAQLLVRQKQGSRAVSVWNEIAADARLPLNARVDALRKAGAAHRSARNWAEALATADRLSTLPGAPEKAKPALLALRGWDRGGVFLAQGDEAKARAEWEAMIASPEIHPSEKGNAWLEIGASLGREAKKKPADSGLAESGRKAYESAWNSESTPAATRVQALLNRAQMEIDVRNLASASSILEDGLKVVDGWQSKEQARAAASARHRIHVALAAIYRNQKEFPKAIAALTQAQQANKADKKIAQIAIGVSQDAFKAKQWSAARSTLLALKETWRLPQKAYLLNLAEIEIAEEKWPAAKKALDEAAALSPTPQELAVITRLRAKFPAGA